MKRGRGFARGFSSARGKGSTPWKSDVASEETLGLVPRYLAPLVDITSLFLVLSGTSWVMPSSTRKVTTPEQRLPRSHALCWLRKFKGIASKFLILGKKSSRCGLCSYQWDKGSLGLR